MNKKLLLTITLLTGTAGLSASQTPTIKETFLASTVLGFAVGATYALYKFFSTRPYKLHEMYKNKKSSGFVEDTDGTITMYVDGESRVLEDSDRKIYLTIPKINNKTISTNTFFTMRNILRAAADSHPLTVGRSNMFNC